MYPLCIVNVLLAKNLDRDVVKDDIPFDVYKNDVLKGSLVDQLDHE